MLAKLLHLQAFITHTKSTFVGNKSYVRKTTTSSQTEICHVKSAEIEMGKFDRLRDEYDTKDNKRFEVSVTRTVSLISEPKHEDRASPREDFERVYLGKLV